MNDRANTEIYIVTEGGGTFDKPYRELCGKSEESWSWVYMPLNELDCSYDCLVSG